MRIGELAARTGVSERSLRYYEAQQLIAPARDLTGQRMFAASDVDNVIRIQELFAAGFCSKGIAEILPELRSAQPDAIALAGMLDAAQARLEDERRQIDRELEVLDELRRRHGFAPDMHVIPETVGHEHPSTEPQLAHAAAFDHRDRRLR